LTIEGIEKFVNDKISNLEEYIAISSVQDKLYIDRLVDAETKIERIVTTSRPVTRASDRNKSMTGSKVTPESK